MKPPTRVRVGPHRFTLRTDREACQGSSAVGFTLDDQETIVLDPAVSTGTMREVVLHELMHAVWGQCGYLDVKYPDGDPDGEGEAIIRNLAPALLLLLRANPKLVEFLTEVD